MTHCSVSVQGLLRARAVHFEGLINFLSYVDRLLLVPSTLLVNLKPGAAFFCYIFRTANLEYRGV